MLNHAEALAQVYAFILSNEWGCSNPHENQNAPDHTANDNRGQNGKEINISFRSSPIITDAVGEEHLNETE